MAAERKLLFLLSWANEQPPDVYELLAMAATAECEKHRAALGSQAEEAAGSAAGAVAAAARQGASGERALGAAAPTGPSVLIEEL